MEPINRPAVAMNQRMTEGKLMSRASCPCSSPAVCVPCGVVTVGHTSSWWRVSAMFHHLLEIARQARIVERRHRPPAHLPGPEPQPDAAKEQRRSQIRDTHAQTLAKGRRDPPEQIDEAHQDDEGRHFCQS